MAHFLKESIVRQAFRELGKRVKKEAIAVLDGHIQACIDSACRVFNGHRTTVDETVMAQVIRSKQNER